MKAQKLIPALLLCMLWLIAPAIANASGDPVVYGITPGRLTSIIAGLAGLTSIVAGGLALRSSASIQFKKRTGTTSLVMGSVSAILSLIHLANTSGGFGTGSGKAGAIVASVLGGIGMLLGGRALTLSRRAKQ